jgi:hypothetical protein
MLPILRILPVGGVLLAIILLVLALSPPDGSPSQWKGNPILARGALIDQAAHPEWRQFLILAAIRRAEELRRLLELPGRAGRAPDAPKVAGLPAARSDSDPDDDQTGSLVQAPPATIPIEIGERSSFELPVAAPEERPPVVRTRAKSRNESRIKAPHRPRHGRLRAKPEALSSFNLFETLFGQTPVKRPPTVGANTDVR